MARKSIEKICPILKAGTMIRVIHTETGHTTVHEVHTESALCLGAECTWWDVEYKRCVIHSIDEKGVIK